MDEIHSATIGAEKEIFFGALDQPNPEARAAYLVGACGKNADLRHRVDQLLADHFEADSFLAVAAVEGMPTELDETRMMEGAGSVIDRYKLLQKVGEGGFGVVYMAEQKVPVKRRVALKIIKLGMDTRQVVARFEAERQALAMMEHPNISKVLDAGATETGRPYFVMELVKGVPITTYCDDNNLTTRERLDLFIPVCQAIQHAHQKGIIHRDIKPSNVMVTLHDGVPVPKVIDFGIAKATQQELTEKTLFTQYSQFIGTPAYMSPEQAEMSGLDIDTRSDIYSLGVLLYELLVGRTPLDRKELMSGGYDEIRRRIIEQEPSKPSTRLSTIEGEERTTIAKHRNLGPNQLSHELQGDLDWIVLKSLEKDRTRRYETANGFALDIQRYLRDEPVSAVAPSVLYKFRKFVRRNKLVFGAAAGITAALVLGLGLSISSYSRERVAHAAADEQRIEAERKSEEAQEARGAAERSRGIAELAEEKANFLLKASRRQTYQADMNLASRYFEAGNVSRMTELVEKHRPVRGDDALCGFEWYHWWQAGRLFKGAHRFDGPARGYVYSPDRSLNAVAGWGERSHWLSIGDEGAEGRTTFEIDDSALSPFLFTQDGASLVVGSSSAGGIRVYDTQVRSVSEPKRAPGDARIRCLAISSSGELMASGGKNGTIVLWDTESWESTGTNMKATADVLALAFVPGDQTLVATMEDATVVVWDLADLANPVIRTTLKGHRKRVRAVASSPSAEFFVTGCDDTMVRLWNTRHELIATYEATAPVTILRFSPDGNRLLAGTEGNNSLVVWDVKTEPPSLKLAHHIKAHSRKVSGADFLHSNLITSVSEDGELAIWKLDESEPHVILNTLPEAARISYSPDGRELLISNFEGKLHRWDFEGRELRDETSGSDEFRTLAFSADGATRAGISKDGRVAIRDAASGSITVSALLINAKDEMTMVLSGDGSTVAWMNADGVQIWNRRKGFESLLSVGEKYLPGYAREFHLPALSHNGERLALSGTERAGEMSSKLWNISDGEPRPVWPDDVGGGGPARCQAFSNDGTLLAIGNWDAKIRLYETETGLLLNTLKGHSKPVKAFAYSPDGSRLVSSGEDHKLYIWDLETGALLSTLQAHECIRNPSLQKGAALAWSPNDESIAALSEDGTIKVWISTPREKVGNPLMPLEADAPPVETILVPADSQWRWLHPVDGVDPAGRDPDFHASFFATDFDDAVWKTGQDSEGPGGGFGYGDQSGIDIGTPAEEARYSAYFRHHFTTDMNHVNLELRCQRDDGIIVYLDGVEVGRDNLNQGEDEAFYLRAAGTVSGVDEGTVYRVPLPGELPTGDHVLAISVHNADPASSDLRISGITLVEVSEN